MKLSNQSLFNSAGSGTRAALGCCGLPITRKEKYMAGSLLATHLLGSAPLWGAGNTLLDDGLL